MLKDEDEIYQKGLIITDNFSQRPILDFEEYKKAIVKVVNNSYPNFTIGIFGEWGTGKTSLMKAIEYTLKQQEDSVKTIWFDAWKYENEKDFILIPLLKTINFSLTEGTKYKDLKNALTKAANFTLGVSQDIISSTVTTYVGERLGGLIGKSLKDISEKLIPSLTDLNNELDKNAIFYNGIENIQTEINKLRDKKTGNPNLRFIIFIDDLDRCSPNKVLELLESIKIFLPINGFIYILGLSHNTIINLIKKKYDVEGEKYLRKFIQIPITLPEWNNIDIKKLIRHLLDNGIIHNDYKDIIEENIGIIASALEENPRETKRFLNNLIISYEVFVNIQNITDKELKKEFLKELLLVQILNSNWNDLYRYIINFQAKFFEIMRLIGPPTRTTIEKFLTDEKTKSIIDLEFQTILEKYKANRKFLEFFDHKNFSILYNITDWNIFRRAITLTDEQSLSSKEVIDENAIALLRSRKIDKFNILRSSDFKTLDLSNAPLHRAYLSGADLKEVNLRGADLRETNLSEADLSGADLSGAYLSGAKMTNANLSSTYLKETYLKGADLTGAEMIGANLTGADLTEAKMTKVAIRGVNFIKTDLTEADLSEADLTQARFYKAKLIRANLTGAEFSGTDLGESDLTGANLSNVLMIDIRFGKLIIDSKTSFSNAIIDNPNFIDFISKDTNLIPEKITNQRELRLRLEKENKYLEGIDWILANSNLPE